MHTSVLWHINFWPGISPTISQVENLQAMSKTVQEFILFYLFLTRKPNKSGKFENLTIF